MSLIKKPVLTPQRLAANQANAQHSHGAATPEGLERIRDANIQHGFYSRAPGEALEKLGEDREDFQRLAASMNETWRPADDFEARLVRRLTRAIWRWERSDRQLESMSVRQLENLDNNVDRLAAEAKAKHEKMLAGLTSLEYATREEDFCFGNEELLTFDSVYGEVDKGRPGEILILLYRLLKPRPPKAPKGSPTEQPPGAPKEEPVPEKAAEKAGPDALPGIPVAEGRERQQVRSEVRKLIKEEIEAVKVARVERGDELADSTSPYLRDCIAAPTHSAAPLMLRMEGSSFRQVVELTNLLTKRKAEARRASEGREGEGGRSEGDSHYVHENKGP
jgi:hypothetical protein